jgi:gluconolactonase
MITGEVYRYPFANGRPTGKREPFANVLADGWTGGFRGPDGMGFSRDGRLWCTVYGEGCVAVVGLDGVVVDRIRTEGAAPTNVAFGADDERRLYVSEHQRGQIEVFDVDAAGLLQKPVTRPT